MTRKLIQHSKSIGIWMGRCFLGLLWVSPLMNNSLQGQQVTIGSVQPPKTGSLLELNQNVSDSNNPDINSRQGFALPRVSLEAENSLKPMVPSHNAGEHNAANIGLMVHNVKTSSQQPVLAKGTYVWNGDKWARVITNGDQSSFSGWGLTGNTGTNAASDFLGTTDNQPLTFKVNNSRAGYLSNSTTANYNSFGLGALASNTGADNDAFGYNALNANTNGTGNVAVGNKALQSNTGNNNTAVGNATLADNGAGSTNTALGYQAGKGLSTGSNNIAIGANTPLDNAGSNKMNIGNLIFARDLTTDGTIGGEVGIGTSTPIPAAALDVSSSNKGVIFPRIDLKGVNDKNTIPSPPTGLFVFNTHNGDGLTGNAYYYNSGTGDNPVWTMMQPFTPSTGSQVKKNLFVGAKSEVQGFKTTVNIGRFNFSIARSNSTNNPAPCISLSADPKGEVKIAFHMGEYWENSGYSYTSNQSKTFNSSNWNTLFIITSDMSTTERNEFWCAYPGDPNLYRVDFLAMGADPTITFGVLATMY